MYNHWTATIEFKELISTDLMPLLAPFLGGYATDKILSDIQDVVTSWISSLPSNVVSFDCNVGVATVKKPAMSGGLIDVIKSINVTPY